jgi:feruloyl esterase
MIRWVLGVISLALLATGTPALARPQAGTAPFDAAKACAGVRAVDFGKLQDAPTSIVTTAILDYGPDKREVCEVDGVINPTIGFKIVMPTHGWNGKYIQGGCGGACGTTQLFWCDDPLRRGYACLGSDMGHQGGVGAWRWAWNNIQLQGDFGFRSTHVASLAGKAVVAAFYGKQATLSYYWGCSTGGRQAYHEAEFYPQDFAGIVGGSPPINETGSSVQLAWSVKAVLRADGSEILGVPQAQLLHRAVVALCDMNDGIKDGLIGDARLCKFDPATTLCKSGQAAGTCLTAEQVDAARKLYAGPHDSKGRSIGHYGGVMPGSELNWIGDYIDGPNRKAQYRGFIADVWRYLGFNPGPGPSWTLNDLDFDRDPQRLQINEALYRADNPDFRNFKDAGGKFIGFQGWSDTSVVPMGTIDFYETVARAMGGYDRTKDFFRFYAVPGMRHCSSDGDGADNIDFLTALENWVERGKAPDMLTGYNFDWRGVQYVAPIWPRPADQIRFSRPVFPYPEDAIWSGKGDANDPTTWRRVRASPDNG